MGDPPSDEAISSYMSFTNTYSISEARSALERSNGNLEAAVEAYFDSNHGPTASLSNANQERSAERLPMNNSSQPNHASDQIGPIPRRRPSYRAYEYSQPRRSSPKLLTFFFRLWIGPLRLLAIPVSFAVDLGLNVCSLFARLLGLRLPSSMSFHWLGSSLFGWTGPPQRTDPRTAVERWVRDLEEELHARSSYTPAQPGDPTMPRLPEFLLLSYDDAVRKAKEELKVLMVVLISQEHDEIEQFKRDTLMNEELLNLIRDKNILVWGGDVKERDASFAAHTLDATTYPFVGFISLQAQRPPGMGGITPSTNRSFSTNTMAICAKLEGSPYEATSSRSICMTINSVVLPRTTGYLNRLRTEKLKREADRRLREEQDRAYLEAGRKDRERVMKKKAELEAEQRRVEELRLKTLEQERLKNIKLEENEQKRRWRHWARKEMMPIEPSLGGVAIGFRLGNGRRVVRKFRPDEPIKSLYLFVELNSSEESSTDLPRPRPDYVHSYGFKLSTAMPRRTLPPPEQSDESASRSELTISQFGGLDGANVNVEGAFVTESSSDEEEEEEDD